MAKFYGKFASPFFFEEPARGNESLEASEVERGKRDESKWKNMTT